MNPTLPAAIGVLLALPLCVHAEQSTRAADPADPGAAVPPALYESAITRARQSAQVTLTPDKAWRAANETVAGVQAHAGHGAAAAAAPSHVHAGHAAPPAAKPASPPPAAHDHGRHH